MSEKITVYEKPTCSTCRAMNKLLTEMGVDFEKVNYYIKPLDGDKLKELIKKLGIEAYQLVRTKEPLLQQLGVSICDATEDEVIELLVKHPDLLQRPIVERGARAALGRPVENVKTLFV